MATLISAGVDVSVTDESFYASSGQGTVPLIVFATAANKTAPSGTGIAPLTTAAQANRLKLISSQRELVQGYGTPLFYSSQGTPLHGFELNEYGLHAAYQYLGLANRAYVMRADIDLNQLRSTATAPRGPAIPGTYWLDLSATTWGLFQSDGGSTPGSAWRTRGVLLPAISNVTNVNGIFVPNDDYGADGDYAIVTRTTANMAFEKMSGAWLAIGSTAWRAAHPTLLLGSATPPQVTGSLVINGTEITLEDADINAVIVAIGTNVTDITATNAGGALLLTNTAGGNIEIDDTDPANDLGLAVGVKTGAQVFYTNNASYPANSSAGDVWVKGISANFGTNIALKLYDGVSGMWSSVAVPCYPTDLTLDDGAAGKDAAALSAMGTPAIGTVYLGYHPASGMRELRRYAGGRFEFLSYEVSSTAPTTAPADGTLWYSGSIGVDIMVGDGQNWLGYGFRFPDTDPAGVIVSGSPPSMQSDGTPLVEHDLWLNSVDLENYPALYRWDASARRWGVIDKTDGTTPFGIVFGDARATSGPAYTAIPNAGDYSYDSTATADLLASNFVDPDAPAADAYPAGMLLFNTRVSSMNVKVWRPEYFRAGGFDPNTDFTTTTYSRGDYTFPVLTAAGVGRWVNASGNRTDGAMHAGRKAQRIAVVRALAATVSASEELRSEIVYYNIMATPGYPELMDEMVTLNTDQKEVAFIIGDTPARLKPQAYEVEAWAKNIMNSASNGEEGLTTANPYVGLYYPWGLATNTDGTEVMVPPSTIALRTIAYNDSVSYPWFAPAGFQRGLVTNATTVGHLTSEGEFLPVVLNPGQRDTLYLNKINPIAFIPGRGLVVYGQKTLHSFDSALDRINVARLINYLRYQLDLIVKPFLFEQNDSQTRDAARLVVERFLHGIVGLRGLDDFVVICDESNNTPERIDRNELWLDVAIKPTKVVEFIYIPVRIVNSGTSLT